MKSELKLCNAHLCYLVQLRFEKEKSGWTRSGEPKTLGSSDLWNFDVLWFVVFQRAGEK